MKNVTFICVFIILMSLHSGCKENGVGPAPFGAYEYTSYDSLGTVVAKGWFTLIIQESSNVSGEWHIEKVGNPPNIGPQVGNGFLEGSFYQGLLGVELNPNFRDNNLGLLGKFEVNRYGGKWIYSSFIGLTNWGTFEAIRKTNP